MRMRLTLTAALIVTLSALTVFGCAHSQLTTDELFEPGEGRVVVSLPELSCITCGNKVANKLKELPGVSQVAFSKAKVEIGVAFNAEEVSTETILEVSNSVGEKAVLGAGRGNYAPPVAHAKETDTIVISRGEEVTLSEHMALGKVTVVVRSTSASGTRRWLNSTCSRSASFPIRLYSTKPERKSAVSLGSTYQGFTPPSKRPPNESTSGSYPCPHRGANLARHRLGQHVKRLSESEPPVGSP